MQKSILVKLSLYNDLKELKERFKYDTMTSFLNDVAIFFNKNKITPLEYNLDENFIYLNSFVKKRFDDVIKILRAIEKDNFIPLNRKLDEIILNSSVNNINQDTKKREIIKEEIVNNSTENIQENLKINEAIESKNKTIKDYEKIMDEQEILIKNLKKSLNIIKENYVIDKPSFGKPKIIIDLEIDEFNSIL